MKLLSLNTAGVALIVLALLLPTGAVPGDKPPDAVWAEEGVVLSPVDGANGEYAEINPEGNLSIDLRGVNPDATTVVAEVFTVANRGQRPVRIWITHEADESVTVFAGPNRREIVGNEHGITLAPGASIAIGFRIESAGHAPGETLMRSLQVHAGRQDAGDEEDAGTTTGSQDGTPATTPTPEPNETATPTPTPVETPTPDPNETVEVVFDVSVDNASVDIEELDDIPPEADRDELGGPRARIQAEGGVTNRTAVRLGRRNNTTRSAALVLTNTTVTLDGSASLFATSESIDDRRRLAKVVRITPPSGLEDVPATVRMRVARDRLAGTDPANARIGHRNETGWQLLPTRVVGEREGYVVFEARTPGFSVFGLWRATAVDYRWEIETVGTRTGERVDVSFARPGIYNATLTVTDAVGQRDVTDYRILANDRPRVTMETDGNLTAGTPVRLRAVVTDAVGETTVSWKFEDGTSLVGRSVARAFEPGRHVIEIRVEDEYGAATTREFVVVIPERESGGGVVSAVESSLPAAAQSMVVGALGVALLLSRRRVRS